MSATDTFDPDASLNLTAGDDDLFDLSGVDEKAAKFQPMPTGDYPAIVESAEKGISKNSGKQMITWKYKIQHPQYANRTLYHHTPLEPAEQLPRLKAVLMALAGNDMDLSQFRPGRDLMSLVGRRAILKVTTSTYQGEIRNNVKEVMPYRESGGGDGFLSGVE